MTRCSPCTFQMLSSRVWFPLIASSLGLIRINRSLVREPCDRGLRQEKLPWVLRSLFKGSNYTVCSSNNSTAEPWSSVAYRMFEKNRDGGNRGQSFGERRIDNWWSNKNNKNGVRWPGHRDLRTNIRKSVFCHLDGSSNESQSRQIEVFDLVVTGFS